MAALYSISGLTIDSDRGGERRRLVDGVDIEVRGGEIYGLVGESGSGKSISMMTSVGLAAHGLRIVGGTVEFSGAKFEASDQPRLRGNLAHGVSLLFQNAKGALNPFLRVGQQVERALSLQNVEASARPARVKELLASVNLDSSEIERRYAHEISGGQAQRIAMACALATNPRLLIADEPTTALDVTTEREILRLLTRLCRERNMAVVMVSHNLALVAGYCSRLSILHAGHVVECGTAAEIFSRPLHPYTRGLLAAIPDVDRPRDLVPLQGSVWGAGFPIRQCRFHHRCGEATAACLEGVPPLIDIDRHGVRCVLYQERAA